MLEEIYWTARYLHAIAVVVLFVKVWWDQDCSGISVKSQFMYALVFTTRYLDLFTSFESIQDTILKTALIIFSYGTTLPMIFFFWKSYEKKLDKTRIFIMIVSCATIAIWLNLRFTVLEILWAFSLYLETLAMLPQLQFCAEAKGIHLHVIFYIAIVAIHKILGVMSWNYKYDYNDRSEEFRYYGKLLEYQYERKSLELQIAAGIVQILIYCDFVVRIVPRLDVRRCTEHRAAIATVEADVESGRAGSGHFASNCARAVALRPDVLEVQRNMEKLVTAENLYVFNKR